MDKSIVETRTDKEILSAEIKKLQRQNKVFWLIIASLIGFVIGISFAQELIIGKKLSDSVKLHGIVINSVPYDLKERL